MITVKNPDKIMEILRKDFNISTPDELNEAFVKLGIIDISPFCCEIKKRRQTYETNCQ